MPVLLVEPLDRVKLTGIGYDMFSDPLRREAILAAIETGEPRATGRVLLGQQAGSETAPGFLLFSTRGAARRAERPAARHCSLRHSAHMNCSSRRSTSSRLCRSMPKSSTGANDSANLLFRSEIAAADMDFTATRQLLVAGRPWTVEFRPTADFTRPSSPAIPVLLGLFGLMLAAAIALLQRYQARAYEAASTAAGECGKEPARKGFDASGDEASHQELDHTRARDSTPDRGGRKGYRRIFGVLLGSAAGDGRLAGHADPIAMAEGRSRRTAAHRACAGLRQGAARRHARWSQGPALRDDDAGARADLSRTGHQRAEIWRGRQFVRCAKGGVAGSEPRQACCRFRGARRAALP